MTIRMIDHIMVIDDDLDQLADRFRDIGFTVTPGGQQPPGREHALIPFADGSYIELLCFMQPDPGSARYEFQTRGGGLSDFALASDDIEADLAAARERGASHRGPVRVSYTSPTGDAIEWLEAPVEGGGRELPALVQDLSNRELRVPGGEARQHVNGIRGIARVVVATDDIEVTSRRYRALLGQDAERVGYTGESVWGLYVIGDQEIEVHQPLAPGDMSAHIARLGNGPYEIVLRGLEDHRFPPESTGVRISVVASQEG